MLINDKSLSCLPHLTCDFDTILILIDGYLYSNPFHGRFFAETIAVTTFQYLARIHMIPNCHSQLHP